jgi:hypothetical protein
MCGDFTQIGRQKSGKRIRKDYQSSRIVFVAGGDGIRACYAYMMAGIEETEMVTRLGLWSLQNLTFGTGSHFTLVAESMELQFLH